MIGVRIGYRDLIMFFFISHHIFNMGGETGFAALHVFFLIFPPTVSYSINLFFYR